MTNNPDDRFVSYSEALKDVMDRGAWNKLDADALLNGAITMDQVELRDRRTGKSCRFSELGSRYGVILRSGSVKAKSDFDVFAPDFGQPRVTAPPAVLPWDRFKADDGITLHLGQALQAITRQTGAVFTPNAHQASQDNGNAPTRRTGGRPLTYDWQALEDDLLVRIDSEGSFDRPAEAERWCAGWFEMHSKKVPVESEIRKHVDNVLQRRDRQLRRLDAGKSKPNKAGN